MSFWRFFLFWRKPAEPPAVNPTMRSERVQVSHQHKIKFTSQKREFPVVNVSTTGMALAVDPTLPIEAEAEFSGKYLTGHLFIGEDSFLIRADVRHVTETILGCEFIAPKQELRAAVSKYLEHEILGLKLRQVDEKFIRPHERGQAHWFSDGGSNELYFVTREGRLIEFQFSFLGHFLEGSPEKGLAYGIVDEASDGSLGIKPAAMVNMTSSIADSTIASAKSIIKNMQDLPANYRATIELFLDFD